MAESNFLSTSPEEQSPEAQIEQIQHQLAKIRKLAKVLEKLASRPELSEDVRNNLFEISTNLVVFFAALGEKPHSMQTHTKRILSDESESQMKQAWINEANLRIHAMEKFISKYESQLLTLIQDEFNKL